MYTLYYKPGACSLAVHVVLEWVGARYKTVEVNLAEKDYLKINPAGAVPTLDLDNGVSLTQCSAILQYLARQYPQAELDMHEDHELEAELTRWAAFLTGDLHPAFFPVFMPQRYTTDLSEASLKGVKNAGISLVQKKLSLLEQHLVGKEYFLGSKRTYVDAYSIPMVRWAEKLLPDSLKNFSNVSRHHKRLLEDSSVIRVMSAEGLSERRVLPS